MKTNLISTHGQGRLFSTLAGVMLLLASTEVSAQHIDIRWYAPGDLYIYGTEQRDEVYLTVVNRGGVDWLRIRFRTAGGTVPSWAVAEGSGYARYEALPRYAVTHITFYGYGGNDVYSHPNDRVHDLPEAELYGGSGDDDLYGTRYTDYIEGGPGKDDIYGFGGSDALLGGPGNDNLYGEHGNDFLCGGPGSDRLQAGNGNDFVYADAADGRTVDLGNGQRDVRVNRDCGLFPVPVYGDWDGNGVVDSGVFFADLALFALPGSAVPDVAFGLPFDQPVIGDWDRDGKDQVGVFRSNPHTYFYTYFFLDMGQPGWQGNTREEWPGIQFGIYGDAPVIGDWNGDGFDDVGVERWGLLYRDQGPRGYNALPWEYIGIPW